MLTLPSSHPFAPSSQLAYDRSIILPFLRRDPLNHLTQPQVRWRCRVIFKSIFLLRHEKRRRDSVGKIDIAILVTSFGHWTPVRFQI